MKKIIATSLVLSTMTIGLQNAYADTDKAVQVPGTTQQQVQAQRTWLGVALSPVPEGLSRQLGEVIPARQGVMVRSVSPDSPAQKAGIQAFDIILNYGDQKLYSAEQLAGLVATDTANKEVTLGVVRNGVRKDINVTLGSHSLSTAPMTRHPMFGFNHLTRSIKQLPGEHTSIQFPSGYLNANGCTTQILGQLILQRSTLHM